MKKFTEWADTQQLFQEEAIKRILDEKEALGEMPYSTIWPSYDTIMRRLGLDWHQIRMMLNNKVLTPVRGGFQINKDKLMRFPQMGEEL